MFRRSPFASLRKSNVCDRTQTSRGLTPLSLFLLIVILFQVSLLWTILMKKLKHGKNCRKRSSKQVTEAGPNFSVQTTSKLVRRFAHNCSKGTIFRTLGRKLFVLCTALDVVTCWLESIIHLSHTLAYSSQPPMSMTLCASGVQKLKNQRRIQGLQVQTLRRPPTSETTS